MDMKNNKITPSKLFTIDESKITEEQLNRLRDEIRKHYTGPRSGNFQIIYPNRLAYIKHLFSKLLNWIKNEY